MPLPFRKVKDSRKVRGAAANRALPVREARASAEVRDPADPDPVAPGPAAVARAAAVADPAQAVAAAEVPGGAVQADPGPAVGGRVDQVPAVPGPVAAAVIHSKRNFIDCMNVPNSIHWLTILKDNPLFYKQLLFFPLFLLNTQSIVIKSVSSRSPSR